MSPVENLNEKTVEVLWFLIAIRVTRITRSVVESCRSGGSGSESRFKVRAVTNQ